MKKTLRNYLLNIPLPEGDLTELELNAIEKAVGEYLADSEKVVVSRKQLENIRNYIEAHQERVGFYGKGVYDLTIWLLGNLPLETFYAEHVENKELLVEKHDSDKEVSK
jgi:hypothetical protein